MNVLTQASIQQKVFYEIWGIGIFLMSQLAEEVL